MMARKPNRTQEQADARVLAKAIREAFDITTNYVDPYEDRFDPSTGELWLSIGAGGKDANERIGTPQTWSDLKVIREKCRTLAATNEFAINGHENRISYIVGSGHTYDVKWKEGEESEDAKDDALESVKAVVEEFVRLNHWHRRQQEIVRRKDRDGECFLRLFLAADGTTRVRFVEPVQVQTPEAKVCDDAHTFGIQTDPNDVETVLGYWIDGTLIDAAEIQHRKANVDANVKRGVPLFWPVVPNLCRAEKLLRNMSVVAEIQSAIAMIRKHGAAGKSGLEQFVSGQATKTVTNSTTGTTDYFKRYPPGTILDALGSTEYEFPSAKTRADSYVGVLQAELRAIASRLVMPEFMLSSDASNANYSSTMVAEGLAVKMFERLQWDLIEEDLELLDTVLRHAESAGKIPSGLLDRISLMASPPNVQTRDRLKDAQADAILVDKGAMSSETMAERHDLVWEVEKERLGQQPRLADPNTTPATDGEAPETPTRPDTGVPAPIDAASQSGQVVQTAQDLVLNGAQIQAALSIVTSVAAGEMPRDAGIGQLAVLFNLSPQQAEQIMGSAGTSTPTTPNPRPNQPAEPDPAEKVVPATESHAAACRRISEALWSGYP
jgi:capsid protein